MEAASAIRKIPLNKLVLSPANVRKTPPPAAEDAGLKASLKAHGLKQNLIVHASADKGVYAVVAGGRRLKALQELAGEGIIPADYKVPCLVEEPDEAIETSLLENTVRSAMCGADEFVAMAALIDSGQSIEAVAIRFGVSEKHVKQRLRLGKLAPELLEEFRGQAIAIDAMMAFTLNADHAAQLAVWRQVKGQPYNMAQAVRRLLTQAAIPVDSRLGAFVGVAAYEAAGGAVMRDLFSTDDDDGFMDDAALVQRLAIEKLEAKAAELRPSWSWTKAVLDPDYGFAAQYNRVYPEPTDLPPEIADEMERIEQRFSEIEGLADGGWTDELAAEAERLEERQTELTQLAEERQVYADEDRAIAGCIVTVDHDGHLQLHKGLVDRSVVRRDAPVAGKSRVQRPETSAHDGSDGDEPPEYATADDGSAPAPAAEREDCGFSQVLADDLTAHRLQITKAHLAADFGVAFDLALYSLCLDVLSSGYRPRPLDLKAADTRPRSSLGDLAGTPADQLLEAHKSLLDIGWLSLPPAEGFEALSALPPDAKQRLFAWCIAASLKGQLATGRTPDPVLERAGEWLAIPFADFWRPTAANYWGRVKKADALAAASAILGPRWARDYDGAKKAVLAAALEKAFDPAANAACIGLERAARDAAAAWLPPGMAYAADALDAEAGAGTGDQQDEAESAELPAFLTGDTPSGARLNGASAP